MRRRRDMDGAPGSVLVPGRIAQSSDSRSPMLLQALSRSVPPPTGRIALGPMTEPAPDVAVLLDRSPAASRSRDGVRAAIETAVAELVDALRTHHLGTADHSNRLAAELQCAWGWSWSCRPTSCSSFEFVAILHDIGKLAVPAAILDLARPLERRESGRWCREHTIRGAEILMEIAGSRASRAPSFAPATSTGTGSGYPDHLVGAWIPLGARVVFTVDAFDAMTNDRPYRRALGYAEARRRIADGAGSEFDPRVVRAVLSGALTPAVLFRARSRPTRARAAASGRPPRPGRPCPRRTARTRSRPLSGRSPAGPAPRP